MEIMSSCQIFKMIYEKNKDFYDSKILKIDPIEAKVLERLLKQEMISSQEEANCVCSLMEFFTPDFLLDNDIHYVYFKTGVDISKQTFNAIQVQSGGQIGYRGECVSSHLYTDYLFKIEDDALLEIKYKVLNNLINERTSIQISSTIKNKIYIIGNGYDVQCGLNSKFKNFYDEICTPFIHHYFREFKYKYINKTYLNPIYKNNIFYILFGALFNTDDSQLLSIKNSITNKEILNDHWYDIEYLIRMIITNDSKNGFYHCLRQLFESVLNNGLGNTKSDCEDFDIFLDYIYNCYRGENPKYTDEKFDVFLRNEFKNFETDFNEYLSKKCDDNLKYESSKMHLIKSLGIDDNSVVINFNYTSVNPNGSKFKIEESNVHGKLKDNNIIIGIDKRDVDVKLSRALPYTKTYRKLFDLDNSYNNILPDTVHDIYFYGHSLSEQDYSYFQSIFDVYDIYNPGVILHFMYSDNFPPYRGKDTPDDMSDEDVIRNNLIMSLYKLFDDYGKTLNNIENGKNLIHKLILEKRIKIEKVNVDNKAYEFSNCITEN